MKQISIVSIFVVCKNKLLLLKRSGLVATNKHIWSVISGYLDMDYPLLQAYTELEEEAGLSFKDVTLNFQSVPRRTYDKQNDTEWIIYIFLFETNNETLIKLNWENTDFAWVDPADFSNYETVPSLSNSFTRLLELSKDHCRN